MARIYHHSHTDRFIKIRQSDAKVNKDYQKKKTDEYWDNLLKKNKKEDNPK